jgi:hypothetical protein
MCLADMEMGLDGKIDTSESQTLARAPGPPDTFVSSPHATRKASTDTAPPQHTGEEEIKGRAREAEESKSRRPDGGLPKLTSKQVLYLGYGTALSVLCDDPQEMYLKGRSSTPCWSS